MSRKSGAFAHGRSWRPSSGVLAVLTALVIAVASTTTEGTGSSSPILLSQAALAPLLISAAVLIVIAGPIMAAHRVAGAVLGLAGTLLGVVSLLVCVGATGVLLVWLLVASPSVAAAVMALLALRGQAA